jgi:hypothetical protein
MTLLISVFAIAIFPLYLIQVWRLVGPKRTEAVFLDTLETLCDLNPIELNDHSNQVQKCTQILLERINHANEIIRISTAGLQALSKSSSAAAKASFLREVGAHKYLYAETPNQDPEEQVPKISSLVDFQASLNTLQSIPPDEARPPALPPHPHPTPAAAASAAAAARNDTAKSVCHEWATAHGVVPGEAWGTLPKEDQQSWSSLNCDCLLTGRSCSHPNGPGSVARSVTRESILAAVARRPAFSRLPCQPPAPPLAAAAAAASPLLCAGNAAAASAAAARLPVVAVLVPTSSRGQRWANANSSHLLTRSLPSLLRHAEAGFRYRFYVGYDSDDAFYARDDVRRGLMAWLREALAAVPHPASAALAAFDNELRKPGPVFNFLSAAAAEDGADYIYRINDDTKVARALAACFPAPSRPAASRVGEMWGFRICDSSSEWRQPRNRNFGSRFRVAVPGRGYGS